RRRPPEAERARHLHDRAARQPPVGQQRVDRRHGLAQQGPTRRGPTRRGPTRRGPTRRGPTRRGAERRGPTRRGAERQSPGPRLARERGGRTTRDEAFELRGGESHALNRISAPRAATTGRAVI